MNLGDPELELIDPTPNIHNLFIQFDKLFFSGKLVSRAVVRWSKRMYSCAGICSYEGRGGLCDIALSEPLLKLRSRKDLVETLLHEMIHAFLFITCRDNDRDGHGPNFKAHMYRINKHAGINISIYHDFHDEVKLYQTHVWRCNGSCRQKGPHFGIVRKPVNKAPGPKDYWWKNHLRYCGGNFIKIEEPGKSNKKNCKKVPPKPSADITKYISTNKTGSNVPQNIPAKPILKDSNTIPVKTIINSGKILVKSKNEPVYKPQIINKPSPVVFSGKGETITNLRPRSNSVSVVETVRNIWAKKQLPTNPLAATNTKQVTILYNIMNSSPNRTTKHKIESNNNNPPAKITKIDDYFKTKATAVLKDVYGKDFQITQSDKDSTVIAVSVTKSPPSTRSDIKTSEIKSSLPNKQTSDVTMCKNLVDCPVCKTKVSSDDINRHLDECLNKEVIDALCKDSHITSPPIQSSNSSQNIVKVMKEIVPALRHKTEIPDSNKFYSGSIISESVVCPPIIDSSDMAKMQEQLNTALMILEQDIKNGDESEFKEFDPNDIRRVKDIVKKINYDKVVPNSDKFVVSKEEKPYTADVGFLPSFLDDVACKIEAPKIKIEPGASNIAFKVGQICACCGKKMDKPIDEHLDECLAFFDNNNTMPNEGASTSFANETIVIDDDDDDIFDESQIYNATGTKTPCPCCFTMIEDAEMADHLDLCLS